MTWDPTKPTSGSATTQSVRDNFAALDTALRPLLYGAPMSTFGGSLAQTASALTAQQLLGISGTDLGNVTGKRILGNTLTTPSSVQEIALALPLLFFPGSGVGTVGAPSLGIQTGGINYSLLQNVTPSRLLGNPSPGNAPPSEISLVNPLIFAGQTLRIQSLGVDNTLIAAMPANTVKGNNTAGSNSALNLTIAQLQAMLTSASLINVQVFTGNGAYAATAGTNFVVVEVQAPGGGGGGGAAAGAGNNSGATGGGAGAYAEVYAPVAIANGATVTAPAGGNGGVAGNNPGTAGSAASFILAGGGNISISCPGGVAGTGSAAFIGNGIAPGGVSAAPTISNGTTLKSTPGGSSNWSTWLTASSVFLPSHGANSLMGVGGATTATGNGSNATGAGAGGSGGFTGAGAGATSGGNGSGTRIIVREYR